jgi:dTDP-4-dehydrorhamnose reductase
VGKVGRGVKIAILGSGGRLGAALARAYAEGNEIFGFSHASLDIGSPEEVEGSLGSLSFDVLINCAALTNVDYCETNEDEAMRINADAARHVAEICARRGARCIHISTDYVFSGDKHSPYAEEDEARPISVYGESKRRGEVEVLGVSPENLVVRVSWVFGPDRPSFVDGILKNASKTSRLEAIGDKFSAPSYTLDLAEWLRPFCPTSAAAACFTPATPASARGRNMGSLRSTVRSRRVCRCWGARWRR